MTQIPPQQAIQVINEAFKKWGLPKRIKLDNGWPFIHPCHREIPTLSILWWIGLGIEVTQNDPASPQQNGTVEGLQNICYRWVTPSQFNSVEDLQTAVNQTGQIQRGIYKVPAKGYATRLELYPELLQNPRKTSLTSQFNFNRIEDWLAQQVWQKTILQNGSISFMNHNIYVGKRRANQDITLTYDPLEHLWLIHSIAGHLLKTYNQSIVNEQDILQYAGVAKKK